MKDPQPTHPTQKWPPHGHYLSDIDIKAKRATCSNCGPTEIVVVINPKHPTWSPMIYCITRKREINRIGQRRLREKKHARDPNWKPKHSLSKIDSETMRAVCSICGPTDIFKARTDKRNHTLYRCAEQARKYARQHYKPTGVRKKLA